MQPFPVLCETCGAKLKVRDPAAVGQIHACPKCESMVMIAVPAAWSAENPPAPQSTEPQPSPAADETLAPSDFAAEVDQLLQNPAEVENPASIPPGGDDTLQQHAPASTAEAASTMSRTSLLVWGTAGSIVCFTLGLLAAAWWMQSDEPESSDVAVNIPVEQAETEIEKNKAEVTPTESEIEPRVVETNKPVLAPSNEIASEPSDDHVEVESEVAKVALLPELPPVVGEDKPASNEEPPASSVNMLPPLDPLAIDSANLDLLLVPDQEAAPETAPEPEAPPLQPTSVPVNIAAAPREMRFEPGSARRGPTFVEGFAEGELTSRLETTLPAVAWRDAPFHQAISELSRVSGVPTTIQPAVLRMAGIRANRPVSIERTNASILDLADAVGNDVKLDVVRVPGGIAFAKDRADDWRQIRYRVDDLLGIEANARGMAALVQKMVAPESWANHEAKITVDGETLAIDQRTAVHFEVLVFCERLRKARGLTTRSKYPSDRLALETRLAGLAAKLDRRTTFAFVDWTSLVDVFDYLQQASGFVLLIDWQHLADQDLRPQSTLAGSVNNVAWSVALDTCLDPLELAWVPVDADTLQITTRDNAKQAAWIEFYPGANANALREQLGATCDASDLETLVIVKDASGKFVMVRGNRSVHEAIARKPRA